jgi:hypothetical protein
MALTVKEQKERREIGRLQAVQQMTFIRKIHRSLVNGRPPASEFKTPLSAVSAARVLYTDLQRKLTAEGLPPKPGDLGVSVGYVSPDLSVLGFTALYAPGSEDAMLQTLNGNIMLGLVFGIVDEQASDPDERFVMGNRPFVSMKQVDGWLSELEMVVRLEMEDAILDRGR